MKTKAKRFEEMSAKDREDMFAALSPYERPPWEDYEKQVLDAVTEVWKHVKQPLKPLRYHRRAKSPTPSSSA